MNFFATFSMKFFRWQREILFGAGAVVNLSGRLCRQVECKTVKRQKKCKKKNIEICAKSFETGAHVQASPARVVSWKEVALSRRQLEMYCWVHLGVHWCTLQRNIVKMEVGNPDDWCTQNNPPKKPILRWALSTVHYSYWLTLSAPLVVDRPQDKLVDK